MDWHHWCMLNIICAPLVVLLCNLYVSKCLNLCNILWIFFHSFMMPVYHFLGLICGKWKREQILTGCTGWPSNSVQWRFSYIDYRYCTKFHWMLLSFRIYRYLEFLSSLKARFRLEKLENLIWRFLLTLRRICYVCFWEFLTTIPRLEFVDKNSRRGYRLTMQVSWIELIIC